VTIVILYNFNIAILLVFLQLHVLHSMLRLHASIPLDFVIRYLV